MAKLLVGLGNPGPAYAGTRHNVGFMVIDALARLLRAEVRRKECRALVGEAAADARTLILAKPQTYVNLSGEAVRALAQKYAVAPGEILVVYDDMDLPLGCLRLRPAGGAGGHRGMLSIIAALGTEAFPRLRVGIGRGEDAVAHVLGRFAPEEEPVVGKVIDAAARAALLAATAGIDKAMNTYNNWRPCGR
ncbi:MAG: aminoacyl-tRNA hydrolase [Bacillota bacterium]